MNTASNGKPEVQPEAIEDKTIKPRSKIESGLLSTNKVMVFIAAIALFGMMAVTVIDVIGRYFFNSPLMGAYELVGILLAMAGTWSMAYTQIQKGHIRVDFIFKRFPKGGQVILTSLAHFVGLLACSILTWRLIGLTDYFLSLKKGNATDTLGIPLFPFVVITAIGTGMLAIVLLFDFIHALTEVKRK
jgi:TRAP-type C4-dicarboxylate transport system permease small subunit